MAYVSLITNLESILLISGQRLLDLYLEIYCRNDAFSRANNKYYLRNEFDFRKVHGIINTSGLLQSK